MNSIQKRTEKRDSAVSPVVGVMLMLVVTIIIAAVVAAFAGGLVTNTEATPIASLDVNIYSAANVGGTMSSTYAPDFTIDHLSGDPLSTADLRITFTWTNSTGHIYRSTYTGAETGVDYTNVYGNTSRPKTLYVNDMTLTGNSSYFGYATLSTGDHMQTGANYLGQDVDSTTVHTGSPFMDTLMGADLTFTPVDDSTTKTMSDGYGTSADAPIYKDGIMKELPPGTGVHVTITHIPSGKAIYDKVVYVQ